MPEASTTTPTSFVRRCGSVTVGLVVVAAGFASAGPAQADVYWSNALSIGHAKNNGSAPDPLFIRRAYGVDSLATDKSHLYWTNNSERLGTIGRSKLDGSRANALFITRVKSPRGVAVNRSHVYWTSGDGTIGRASKVAGKKNQKISRAFIAGLQDPYGIAVNSKHIFWIDGADIGRANLDGTGVDRSFITGGADQKQGTLAITASHLYWAENYGSSIARARINGTQINRDFVTGIQGQAWGVAVDRRHLYWSNGMLKPTNRAIGRSRLNGSQVNYQFIPGSALVAPGGMMGFGLAVSRPVAPGR